MSFDILRGELAVARAFDNRIGTFAVAEALRLLKESKGKFHTEICAVSNVQEEVGLLGARQIAYSLKTRRGIGGGRDARNGLPDREQGAARRHRNRQRPGHHARRLQSSRSRGASRSGGEGEEDSAAT